MKRSSILFAIVVLIAAALSCNLPSAATSQQQSPPQSIAEPQAPTASSTTLPGTNLYTGCHLNSSHYPFDDARGYQSHWDVDV